MEYPLPETLCYLNGRFGAVNDTQISVMDRGFIFGDGVYEVIPVYNGRMFCFEQHMARLARSLAEVSIGNPLALPDWHSIAQRLIDDLARTQGVCQQMVYIQVTRGIAPRDHVMPPGLQPTVYMMVTEMKPASALQREQGVACITAEDFRWKMAHIKSTSLLGAVLARQISADVGAVETVMFRGGFLSEAAASNVWVVKDGEVSGPPKDHQVLEGIRYGLIERICKAEGLAFALHPINRDAVLTADELLLSSASKEVLPIRSLDGRTVGAGKPGPVYERLYAGYQAIKTAECG